MPTHRTRPFSRRPDLVEHIDRPDCSLGKLYRTLDQFTWINAALTGSRRLLRKHVIRDMLGEPQRVWRFLDLGAGGCDITVWMLRQAAKRGLRIDATALEHDPRIVAYAQAKYGDMAGLRIVEGDALDPAWWEPVDYVFANHLLHHLDDAAIVRLLPLIAQNTRRVFVLNDIRRSRLAYLGYALSMGLLAHRSFALADGLTSIRRGFLPGELQSLLRQSHLEACARVETRRPARIVVIGGPSPSRGDS